MQKVCWLNAPAPLTQFDMGDDTKTDGFGTGTDVIGIFTEGTVTDSMLNWTDGTGTFTNSTGTDIGT